MATGLAERPMAKRNDASARLDVESLSRAKIAASMRDLSLAEYLSVIVLERANSDIEEWKAREAAARKPKGKG